MPTTFETVLAALHARLHSLAALVLRDDVLPECIPAAGLIILRDGQPGEPEVINRLQRRRPSRPARKNGRRPGVGAREVDAISASARLVRR